MVVAPGIELQLAVMNQVGGELAYVHHLGGARILKTCTRHRRHRHFQKVGRPVHGVHVLVQHAPHMPAFAAQNPLHSEPLRFVVYLGVQPLHHLVRAEQAEVAALAGVSAPV